MIILVFKYIKLFTNKDIMNALILCDEKQWYPSFFSMIQTS